jgi:hypothetical protein
MGRDSCNEYITGINRGLCQQGGRLHEDSDADPCIYVTVLGEKGGVLKCACLYSAFARQQCLYFFPLPQGQGTLRPTPWRCRGTNGSSNPVSW